ncbi:hydrogenase [bacterium]|nr:hydrogenase [bacterium]MBU1958863.1 hydrogenase [bacterium]
MLKLLKNEKNRQRALSKPLIDDVLLTLQQRLKEAIKAKFSSKLKLYIIDTGSCTACELELQGLFNPLYNVSKLGVEVVYDVREADIMLMTGLLTENMYHHCMQKYKVLKEPKRVIAIGDCPLFHAPFKNTFALKGESSIHCSTAYHIAGCPPEPKKLLQGLLAYIETLEI